MIPLLALHLYAVTLAPKPLRRAVQTARALGVTRRQAVTALLWAAVYGGDAVMETAFDAAGDVFEAWTTGRRARAPASRSRSGARADLDDEAEVVLGREVRPERTTRRRRRTGVQRLVQPESPRSRDAAAS